LGEVSISDDIVPPSTNPDSLTTSIIDSTVEAISATKSRKRTTTSSGPTQLSGVDTKAGLLGSTTSVDSIVTAGSAADPVSLTVLQSSVTPIDSAKSKKTTVTSTGPTSLVAKKISDRGEVQTITKSIVASNTETTTDSLLLVSSQVDEIDSAKSQKTDITVPSYVALTTKSKKAGLLGEASISDEIVSPTTNPDALTTSIIDSTVEAISATKSRKRTTTSSGPTSLTAKKISERGDTQTITKSIVAASTGVTADSLTLVSSQVDEIDAAKSQKTDVTVASYATLTTKTKKSGLLGESSTSDEIVDPATNPDSLSTTIIDSTVEAISATKSRKRTTTSTGPSSLSGNSKKEGLLGEVSVVESIVAAGASSDNLSTTVISSEVTPIDSAKSKKTTITSTGPDSLAGATYKAGLLGETEEEQSIVAAGSLPDTLTEDIISSQVIPIDSAKSKKVTVTATGPTTLTAERISERGDTQTITKSIVPASEGVTADALFLVSSQVDEIDSAKSQKTDTTVASYAQLTTKSKKSGLLGSISTTDDIVDPSTDPDELSIDILESSVEAISATKSRKRTTTADGPTQLDSDDYKSGLLGETKTSQSIVAYGTAPDALSETIVSSSVEAIDEYKSRKTTVESTGPTLLSGVATKAGLLGDTSIEESIVATGSPVDALSLTVIQSQVTPIDSAKSKKTTVESTGPTSLTAKKISERGDVQTITKSIVTAATGTTTDSLNLVSSQVDEIDAAKSQKTDVTVSNYSSLTTKSNKAGLLGQVSITDDIVAPSTNPDALSLLIIDSSVEAISATKSRKRTTTSSGPSTLSGNSQKAGLLGSTTTTETIVAAGASADALTLTRIQSEITPIDSAKSKKTTVDSTGPTQLDGKTIGEFGLVSLEQSIVSYASALPTPTENTIDLKKEPIDLAKAKLIESSYDSPEVLNGYQYDADLNLIISNTKEIISEGAAPLSPTNGLLAYTDTPINAWQSIRIQSKITSLPTARTEYKTGAYASPNLITGFVTTAPQMPNWDINVNVTPVMRAKRSYQTVFKSVTSYVYGNPDPTPSSYTIYDPVSINVYYDGYFFKINIPDALTNQNLSVSFTTASNDPVHGYIDETYDVPESAELASSYLTKIGTYQLIAYEIDYWKANIWRVVEQYVLLK
jgi:hypothetical protein